MKICPILDPVSPDCNREILNYYTPSDVDMRAEFTTQEHDNGRPDYTPQEVKCSGKELSNCIDLYRDGMAISRQYRSQILQVNMRRKALAEIYIMHSFAHLCNRNFLANF